LTGAVASKRITEAFKGRLRLNGNQPQSAKAQAGLTARPTRRAEGKPGLPEEKETNKDVFSNGE